jgi:hypothetical protein
LSASTTSSSLLLGLLFAITPLYSSSADGPVLSARPGLCILQDPESKQCVMGVELNWHGPEGNYCLYDSTRSHPLACWQSSSTGEHSTELASRQDVAYWLQQDDSDSRLAEISVRIVSLAQRNPERRRRRHAWTPL